jgi:hypothetical protein
VKKRWFVRSNDNSFEKSYFVNGPKVIKKGKINMGKLVIFRSGCRNENVNNNELKTMQLSRYNDCTTG